MFRPLPLMAAAALAALTIAGNASAQHREPAANAPARAFEAKVREGMAYKRFRAEVMAAGWTGEGDPECSRSNSAELCTQLHELDDCSADGMCRMTFVHPDEDAVLRAATYGDILRWQKRGEEADVAVRGWGYE
ncbi:MAG: hypothetical protein EON96_05125 [Caulobacteraceae bacterium]|nr:MAG: hypothetical protein EON96_05125 [Caulobacteraceae bacterium]